MEWIVAVGLYGDVPDYEIRDNILTALGAGFLPDAPDQSVRIQYNGVDYCIVEMELCITDDDEFQEFSDLLIALRSSR